MNEPCGRSPLLGAHVYVVDKIALGGEDTYDVSCKFCFTKANGSDRERVIEQFIYTGKANKLADAIKRDSQIDARNSKGKA